MSEDKSSDELPDEVVRQIEDIVRKFHDELSDTTKREGNVVRPMPAATATSKALAGVCLIHGANSGDLTVQVSLAEILKLDLPNILNGMSALISFFLAIQGLLIAYPKLKTLIIRAFAKYLEIPID